MCGEFVDDCDGFVELVFFCVGWSVVWVDGDGGEYVWIGCGGFDCLVG